MDGLGKLGIDVWGILYYLINYGLILAVLGIYVYPKIDLVLKKRQKDISDSLDNASNLKSELTKEVEKYHKEHARLLEEIRLQKKDWLAEIESMKSQILTEMEEKRSRALEETDRIIAEKKSALLNEARQVIYAVIVRSFHNLSKKIPEPIIQESIDDAWSMIHK